MNRFVLRCIVCIQQLPFIPYVMLFLLLSILVGLPYTPVDYLQGDWMETVNRAPLLMFFLTCVAVPLLFAVMLQLLPYALFKSYTKHKTIRIACFSAIAFAAATYSTAWQVPNSLLLGLMFALCYLGYRKRSPRAAFWAIATVLILRSIVVFAYILLGNSFGNAFLVTIVKSLL